MIAKILYYRYTCCNATLQPLIRNALQTTNGSKPGSKWISLRRPTKKTQTQTKTKTKQTKHRDKERNNTDKDIVDRSDRQIYKIIYIYIT